MATDDDQAVLSRIQARIDALGLSERGAAEQSGLSASAIRNIREGKSQSPRLDTMRKLAPTLKVTPEWLAFGVDEDIAKAQEETAKLEPAFLPVIGEVAAGRWLEADDHVDAPEYDPVPVQPDSRWRKEDQYGLLVRGTSLNRIALDGDILACVNAIAARYKPREDDLVIVEMRRNAGLLRQRTAKRYMRQGSHVELWPDSDDPRWQKPIIIPLGPNALESTLDDEEGRIDVSIIALVTWVHRPIQKRRR